MKSRHLIDAYAAELNYSSSLETVMTTLGVVEKDESKVAWVFEGLCMLEAGFVRFWQWLDEIQQSQFVAMLAERVWGNREIQRPDLDVMLWYGRQFKNLPPQSRKHPVAQRVLVKYRGR